MNKKLSCYITVFIFFVCSTELIFPESIIMGLSSNVDKGKIRLEQYLERADSFRDNVQWHEIANEGIQIALCEWEKFNALDADSLSKNDVFQYYSFEVNERYRKYLDNKINDEKYSNFYSIVKKALEELSIQLLEKNLNKEISEEQAKSEWNSASKNLIEYYLDTYNMDSENLKNSISIEELSENIGRTLILNELFDRESLMILSDKDSASFIANDLIENIQKKTNSSFNDLFSNIYTNFSVDEKEISTFSEKDWLNNFEVEMDKALFSWEEAENLFLEKKIEWEESAKEKYSLGVESFEKAYEDFLIQKENWKKDISNRIENAKIELTTLAQEYNNEVNKHLINYDEYLVEQNNSYYENYCLQKETYEQVRDLLNLYKKNAESWLSIWKTKYSKLYNFCVEKNKNYSNDVFTNFINNNEIDLNNINSSFVSSMKKAFSLINKESEYYINLNSKNDNEVFLNIDEVKKSTEDILSFFDGIVSCKNNETNLQKQIFLLQDKVLEGYYSPLDIEYNKAKFHLEEKQQEYEIALAVNNYALSVSNLTENAFDSELNRKNALEQLNNAKEKYESNKKNIENEYIKNINSIKNKIEENKLNFNFVSKKIDEIILLNSEYATAVENLNDENLELEKLKFNVRKANAICDYGNSIYLGKEDALKNLMIASDELEIAKNDFIVIENKKNNEQFKISKEVYERVEKLKKAEEDYINIGLMFEDVLYKINEYENKIFNAEIDTNLKRKEVVADFRKTPELSGKIELIRITKNENGVFSINLDLDGKNGTKIEEDSFNEFFNSCNIEKENRFNEIEFYSAAEKDLLEWTDKMLSEWQYFCDVSLAGLYYVGLNGYLDNVDNKNINPLSRVNSKYILENVDPNDKVDSFELYFIYRQEALQEAVNRVKQHENWQSDVARSILYKDSNSLIGSYLDKIETYSMNIVAYNKLYDEYKDIMDDHSFFPNFIWGNFFMDGHGRAAEACKNKVSSLRREIKNNLSDIKIKLQNTFSNYKNAVTFENELNTELNRILYNKETITENEFCKEDFISVLSFIGEKNTKIDADEINTLCNFFLSDFLCKDIISALDEVYGIILDERNNEYNQNLIFVDKEDETLFAMMDMYKKLSIKVNSKKEINKKFETFYGNYIDSLCKFSLYASQKNASRKYQDYFNGLNETIIALEKNLYEKYIEVNKIGEYSENEWKSAEENLISEYNEWLRVFEKEYISKENEWNEAYLSFLENRQNYISKSYIDQTFAVLGTETLHNFQIANSIERNDEKNKLQGVINSLGFIKSSFEINQKNKIIGSEQFEIEELKNRILSEQKNIAAKQSMYQAYNIIENKKKETLDSIKSINNKEREWEIELVRNSGYTVNGNTIKRKVSDGCTLFKNVYQSQSVHMYRDFVPPSFSYSNNFAIIECLSDEAIKELMEKLFSEYRQWAENIFGVDNNKGLLEKYLGDVPELKPNADANKDDKKNSFIYKNKGEITLILMDLQWNNLEESAAYADFEKSFLDRRIFDSPSAPSLRTTATVTAAITASIVASTVSFGSLTGVSGVLATAALSSAITMSNEVVLSTIDLATGYKSPFEIAKSLASSAVSNGIGIATAGIGSKISNINSVVGSVVSSTLYEGSKSMFGIASNSLIMNDFDFADTLETLTKKESLSKIGSSMISGFVSSSLNAVNLGLDNNKVQGYSSENILKIKSFDSFIADSSSSLFEYGYAGETTINIASVKDVGILEINIGQNGIKSQVGMNGHNMSIGNVLNSTVGLSNIIKNNKINKYSNNNEVLASALRMEYGFGNKNAKKQLEDILNGRTELKIVDEDYIAKSIIEDSHKIILLGQKENFEGDYKKLGVILQHEAERNGINDGMEGQRKETVLSVKSQLKIIENMANDSLYKKEVYNFLDSNKDLLINSYISENFADSTYENYVSNIYDNSEDYWRLTWGGQLINDNQGYLMDENGFYINTDGSRTKEITENTIGAKGLETGLLNIMYNKSNLQYGAFSEIDIKKVQKMMMDAGLNVSNPNAYFKNYNWSNNKKGQKINMQDFMEAGCCYSNDVIFERYYNNDADLYLAKMYGVDLGFISDKILPSNLEKKMQELIGKHYKETPNAMALINKYKFSTATDMDGNLVSRFKINRDNPFIDKVLGQHDFSEGLTQEELNDPNRIVIPELDSKGCNFMQTIAVPQLLTGCILDEEDVLDIWNESGKKQIVDSENALVYDKNKLAAMAIEKINQSFNLSYDLAFNNDTYINDRISFYYSETASQPDHFAVGDKYGNVIYNPGYTTATKKSYQKVFLGEN